MKKLMKRIIGITLAMVCLFGALPAIEAEAATIVGGHTTQATAYNWGTYSNGKSLTPIVLPEGENEFWVRFTVPSNERIYARCSYSNEYAGMFTVMYNSTNQVVGLGADVINPNSVIPFLAANADNRTASSQTFFLQVRRGDFTGDMYFSLTLYDRIYTGNGTFSFSGTASNPGNSSVSTAGVDSSILTLNLTNNTTIPPNAVVTYVSTAGTQSPSQGNVRHKIRPASSGWFTSTVTSATSGTFNVTLANNIFAAQQWEFQYNALATAKSTMKNVKLTLKWEYDIAFTNYARF